MKIVKSVFLGGAGIVVFLCTSAYYSMDLDNRRIR